MFIFLLNSCETREEHALPPLKLDLNFFQLSAKTPTNENYPLLNLTKKSLSVLVFLSPECPVCQNYALTMNELQNQTDTQRVNFIAVFPGTYYTPKQMIDYLNIYHIPFQPILDPKFAITGLLRATVTPEAYLLDSLGNILYSGSIDNQMMDVGKRRTMVTEHFLRDAISTALDHKIVKTRRTQPAGCFIE